MHDAHAIYLLRVGPQHEAVELAVGRFPLHLSIIGLLTLVELAPVDALERLRHSRRLYGWDRPQPQIPEREEDLLALVHNAVDAACILVLPNWRSPGDCLAGCALPPASDGPRVLGLVGGAKDVEEMRKTLRKEIIEPNNRP